MKGFLFYGSNLRSLTSEERDFRSKVMSQEAIFLNEIRESITSSGAGLSRILQHREKADLIFITAYRTGNNPSDGGYGFYKEGEKDSLGNVHKEGDSVSKKENKRQNKQLAMDLEGLGFGFVQVGGHYSGVVEESYCVINYEEDTDFFVSCLSELANKYDQDSILVVPKGADAYLLKHNGSKIPIGFDIHVVGKAIEDYTTLKSHNFVFSVVRDLFCSDSLHPIRSGRNGLAPIYQRTQLILTKV